MKEKEYEWELISEGRLIGIGKVTSRSQAEAYQQALMDLDSDQKKAVLNDEIQLNIQEWTKEKK
jgi:hypothetical protein